MHLLRAIGLATLLIAGQSTAADETDFAARCNDAAADPSRIAVAGGSITEVIYALGEERLLLAVDRTSNYPPAALDLPQVGYVRNLSAEGILSMGPSLILGEDDMGPAEVLEQLSATGVEIRRLPEVHTAQGIVDKVRCVSNIIGLSAEKQTSSLSALNSVLNDLDAVARRKTEQAPRVAILLTLDDGVPTAGGADTSANGVIEMAGGNNVFTDFEGWKPVSLEAMAAADPEYIIMPERGVTNSGGRDGVLGHPAIKLTTAGQSGQLIAIDGMSLLGFGPRTLEVARDLSEAFQQAP
ncbi:MAG: ABC transporter substrate-binding protein [Pseudomonadota bacterium]